MHASPVIPGPDFLSEKYPGIVVGQVWTESVPACGSLSGIYLRGSYKQEEKHGFKNPIRVNIFFFHRLVFTGKANVPLLLLNQSSDWSAGQTG